MMSHRVRIKHISYNFKQHVVSMKNFFVAGYGLQVPSMQEISLPYENVQITQQLKKMLLSNLKIFLNHKLIKNAHIIL